MNILLHKHSHTEHKHTPGHWLGLGFLQQGRVIGGKVNSFLVDMDTSGQMLELFLHMQHVLLYGMESRLGAHFICPPHMDSTHRQGQRQC